MSAQVAEVSTNQTERSHNKRTRTGRGRRNYGNRQGNANSHGNRNAFVNPVNLNPHEVRINHFRDGRLYDEHAPVGFSVQTWLARKNYSNWLKSIRSQPGMEMFRRPKTVIVEEFEGDDGSRVRFRSTVQRDRVVSTVRTVLPNRGNKKRSLLPAQSTGESLDSENYIPKMFTIAMGREFAGLRNAAGLTQAKLARELNVTENHIRRVELGGLVAFNPEDEFVKKLAQVLGIGSVRYHE